MPLKNRYIDTVDNEVYINDDEKYKNDSLFSKFIKGAVIGAFGFGLYKSGALAPLIKSSIDAASNHNADIVSTLKTTKNWFSNNKNTMSLLRTDGIKDLTKKLSSENVDMYISQTKQDVNQLFDKIKIQKHIDKTNLQNKNTFDYSQTQILKSIKEHLNVMAEMEDTSKKSKNITKTVTQLIDETFEITKLNSNLKNKTIDDIIEQLTMTDEIANDKLKKQGYKNLRIKDVFELSGDNGELRVKNSFKKTLINQDFEKVEKTSREFIQAFFLDPKNGNKTFDDIKNMTFDHSLLIDELGNLRDTRAFNSDFKWAINSLSSDFAIPFININPLKILGVDEFTESTPGITLLTGHQRGVKNIVDKVTKENPLIYSNKHIYDAITGELVSDDSYVLKNANGADAQHFLRKLHGLSLKEFAEIDDTAKPIQKFKYKVGKFLDIGFQDTEIENVNLLDPLTYPNVIFQPALKNFKPAREISKKTIESVFEIPKNKHSTGNFVAIKKGIGLIDVFNKESTMAEFIGQIFAGRRGTIERKLAEGLKDNTSMTGTTAKVQKALETDNVHDVTTKTLFAFKSIDTLSGTLGKVGLGFSTESSGSVQSIYSNLLLKRYLPVVVGITAWNYINYESDNILGFQPEDKLIDTYVNLDVGLAKIRDNLGFTNIGKTIEKLTPGSNQLTDIPILGKLLDWTESSEERVDYWQNGEDAVRKGRFWSLGNTAFTGGKVEYFLPNIARRVKSDWQYTDSKYGSRKEFFENSWIPTPRNPLSPVNFFLTDKYHWEEKHYKDRPYLQASTIGEEIPIIGPVFSATIGRLLKPAKIMHKEYWVNNEFTGIDDEKNISVYPDAMVKSSEPIVDGYIMPEARKGTLTNLSLPNSTNSVDDNVVASTTASGQNKIYTSETPFNVRTLNEAIKEKSIKKAKADANNARTIPMPNLNKYNTTVKTVTNTDVKNPNGLKNVIGQTQYKLENLYGMRGFEFNAVFGDSFLDSATIQTSSSMTSISKGFWDMNLGGLTGDFSEIYRRFIPKQRYDDKRYNPIRNTMAQWLPGADYFTDFQIGDPYSKLPYGEMRLPGGGYEAVNNITNVMDMSVDASSLGLLRPSLSLKILNELETVPAPHGESDTAPETDRIHSKVINGLMDEGYLIDKHQKIEDTKNQITGYYDAKIHDETSKTNEAIVEIKQLTNHEYLNLDTQRDMFVNTLPDAIQLNFYLHETKNDKGYLYYVDKDNPDNAPKIKEWYYDKELYDRTIANLQLAKNDIYNQMDKGLINKSNFYSTFDRFKILADIAPYSKEYNQYKSLMSQVPLSDEQHKEYSQILDQVSEKKNPLRLTDYRFKKSSVKKHTVTISKVIDSNTFYTKERPNNPIKLAGVSVSSSDDENSVKGQKVMAKLLKPGRKIQIAVNSDPLNVINNDTYKSISAVVYRGGTNINHMLIKQGYGTELTDDYSAPAVEARFSPSERKIGQAWESFAHLDTPLHTKFLQVRSPLESYKRRHLYGKDYQTWNNPINDYLEPAFDNALSKSPITSIAMGGLIGFAFGRPRNPTEVLKKTHGNIYGRAIGTIIGASVAAIGNVNKQAHKAITNEEWIPKRRQKEREINEYIDMLKFVKNRKLFDEYARESLKKEGYDIRKYLNVTKGQGNDRKKRKRDLQLAKRMIKEKGDSAVGKIAKQFDFKYVNKDMTSSDVMKGINEELEEIANTREINELPPLAMAALYYYEQSEKTMYGYDPGEPLENILQALPKTERMYLNEFVNAPKEERMEILSLVPSYMRRPLEAAWGIPVEKKSDIVQYFKEHQLPGENWEGWNPNVDLNNTKIKIIQKEGLDLNDFNIWKDEVENANKYDIPIPQREKYTESPSSVRAKLSKMLGKAGIKNVNISVSQSNENTINMNLSFDEKQKYEEYFKKKENEIIF